MRVITPGGHSNRVFAVKFHPADPHVLLSAGWDNTVQIWDLRVEGAVRNIFGPHICGDSMDIDCDGQEILTGSVGTPPPPTTASLPGSSLTDR